MKRIESMTVEELRWHLADVRMKRDLETVRSMRRVRALSAREQDLMREMRCRTAQAEDKE